MNMEGLVKDSQGTPLPDVLVIAWPTKRRGAGVAQARTGEDGRFILPGLAKGRWSLLLEVAGLGTLELERQVPEDGAADLVVDGFSRTLAGIVVDAAGRTQPEVRVTMGGPSLRWTRETKTDAAGVFWIRGIGFGRFTLRAMSGQQVSPAQTIVLEEGTTRERHVRLMLSNGVNIQGEVVDEKGHFLEGARVDVLAIPADDLPLHCSSDEQGRFTLGPLSPGHYQLLGRLDGYVLMDAPEVHLTVAKRSQYRIRMARSAQVHGKVVDEAGDPLPNLPITVLGLITGQDELTVIPGPLPSAAEAAATPLGQLTRPGAVRSANSDVNGEFLVTGLSPGRSRLQILPHDRLPLRREPLLLVAGEVHEVGTLLIHQGVLLDGALQGPEGVPLDGVIVEARPLGRTGQLPLRVSADVRGQFSLRLPIGRYAMTAANAVLATSEALTIEATQAQERLSVPLQLVPRKINEMKR
jgi:protocatechuate 3,4-dioxygenase beta subunit